ncbi:MAG: hypothetical protein RBG13Loki_0048 [Promethearchaeota archaeon CR_4]|nr:MAG: hypothetical protein RBG13Loki_0048 [Candidatus Lokiarchaeota archaeon CR_4]
MSPAIDSIINLRAIDQEDLKKSVTNVLLEAILTKLEEIGRTLNQVLAAFQEKKEK